LNMLRQREMMEDWDVFIRVQMVIADCGFRIGD